MKPKKAARKIEEIVGDIRTKITGTPVFQKINTRGSACPLYILANAVELGMPEIKEFLRDNFIADFPRSSGGLEIPSYQSRPLGTQKLSLLYDLLSEAKQRYADIAQEKGALIEESQSPLLKRTLNVNADSKQR